MSQPSSSDNENYSLRKINQLAFDSEKDSSLALGQFGAVYKSAAGALSGGPWGAIQATAAAVVSLTSGNWTNSDATTAIDIPAGATIFGNFTAVSLTSGKIIAYKQIA
jgi:hypothetical protein